MRKLKKLICSVLLLAFAMSFTAFATDIIPASSDEFQKTSATLVSSSSLTISFNVVTRSYSSELGISKVILHDMTSGDTLKYSPDKMSSGYTYSSRISLSGATTGHKYYADVTFYADGLTKTVQTNTITY